ncbi:MAG TPA: serine hydrolase domain-containing protein [Gemmatimonas sp.]|nr:serine hydrolase domain-containing protein [Gemmatimonas sp.]
MSNTIRILRTASLVAVWCTALPMRADAQLAAGTTPPTREVLAARIDSVVRTDILPRGFPSVSIVVARRGQLLFEGAWGVANITTKQKAASSTTYNIGSMAKQFTATLVLKLVDRRQLALTDSVGRHLKGLRAEWNAISIEQLLNHTSGLARDYTHSGDPTANVTGDALIAMAAADSLVSKPGTAYAYSNTGYLLLAVLVEKLHGKPYRIVLRDEIARPLALASLGWCDDSASAATGYLRLSDGNATLRGDVHASQNLGASSICASARDIATWNSALHGGRVLSAASYTAMTTTRGGATGKYGFGLAPRMAPWGSPAIVHDGQDNGFSSHNGWFPAESLSVTLLYNALPRLEANMADFIGAIALGRTPRPIPPMPVIALPVAATQGEGRPKFVGAYEIGAGRMFIVTYEEGSLHLTPPGAKRQQLYLQSGTVYRLGNGDAETTVTFNVNADGTVSGFTARDNGVDRVLPKVK